MHVYANFSVTYLYDIVTIEIYKNEITTKEKDLVVLRFINIF